MQICQFLNKLYEYFQPNLAVTNQNYHDYGLVKLVWIIMSKGFVVIV